MRVLLPIVLITCLFAGGDCFAAQTYVTKSGETLSDPTRPANTKYVPAKQAQKKKKVTTYTLNYVMNTGGVKRAMINGRKVHEGDFVHGAKVKTIANDSVVINIEGKEKRLYLSRVSGIKRN